MNSELIRSQFHWCEWPTQFGFECCWISNTKNNSDLHSERSCIAYQDEIHNFCSFQLRFDIIQMQRERNMFSDKWIKTFEFHHAQIAIRFFSSLSFNSCRQFIFRQMSQDRKRQKKNTHRMACSRCVVSQRDNDSGQKFNLHGARTQTQVNEWTIRQSGRNNNKIMSRSLSMSCCLFH